MKIYYLVFFIAMNLFASFYDEELELLWAAIEDINHPTFEEYQLIDCYLSTGTRPYLDLLRNANPVYPERLKRILDFKLVDPNQGMPIYKKYEFNMTEMSHERCILLYGSCNGIYPEKAKRLLLEIENSGYSGHVLLRIGGFPNTQFGGLKICHVPYAFKVAFLQEAKMLGYKEVLWIDSAIHPLSSFDRVFWEIQQQGYFFTYGCTLKDNPTHLFEATSALDITPDLFKQIPHISAAMIGLNMENSRALQLLETWYSETEKVIPCITWQPEELCLSVTAWFLGCKPNDWFGNVVCGESEQFQLEKRPKVQFYVELLR